MGNSGDAPITAFEAERIALIARHKEEWSKISAGMKLDALQKEAPKQTAKPPKPRAPKAKPEGPARRSDRNAGKERPDYRGQQELKLYVEQEHHRSRGRARKAGSTSTRGTGKAHRYNAWHPWIPQAPAAAQEAAWEAAVAKAEELDKKGKAAYPKVLGDSMVSGGFWLHQNPIMTNHFDNDASITFTTSDKARPQSTFRYTQAKRNEGQLRKDAWNVIFKQKRHSVTQEPTGGYGMSGNWKGFAVDNFLHSGDVVVIVPGPKAAGAAFSTTAEVHIFRCWDYASEASKPANLKELRYKALPPGTLDSALAAAGIGDAAAAGSGSEAAGKDGDEQGADEDEGEQEDDESDSEADDDDDDDDAQQRDQQQHSSNGESEGSTQQDHQQQQRGRKRGRPGSNDGPKTKNQQQQQKGGAQKPQKTDKKAGNASRQVAAAAAAPAGGSKQGVKRGRGQPAAAAAAEAGGSRQRQAQQKQEAEAKRRKQPAKQRSKTAAAPAAVAAEEPDGFTVDWILDTKVETGRRLYLVRWLGYSEADDSWEPRECFDKPPRSYDWKCPIPDDVPRK